MVWGSEMHLIPAVEYTCIKIQENQMEVKLKEHVRMGNIPDMFSYIGCAVCFV
jgi:hypothetical protein